MTSPIAYRLPIARTLNRAGSFHHPANFCSVSGAIGGKDLSFISEPAPASRSIGHRLWGKGRCQFRHLMPPQGQRGLCAARRTAMTETGPSLSSARGGHEEGRAGPPLPSPGRGGLRRSRRPCPCRPAHPVLRCRVTSCLLAPPRMESVKSGNVPSSTSRRWYRAPPWAGVGRLPLAERSACGLPPPLTGRLLAPSATGAFQVPIG